LLLTFAAGFVDIVGYLAIYQTFTAHMTGATVHVAQNLVAAHWMDAVKAGCVVSAFLLGSVIGRTIIEIGTRVRMRSIASATLLIEAALIVAVARWPILPVMALLAMLAAAMGLQTATLTRVGSLTVHTTFVTGMLNKLAQLLSHAAFTTYDILCGRPAAAMRQQHLRQAKFILSIWFLYLAGAAAGTWAKSVWGVRGLLFPAGTIAIAIVVDQVTPLSIEEEHDQPER